MKQPQLCQTASWLHTILLLAAVANLSAFQTTLSTTTRIAANNRINRRQHPTLPISSTAIRRHSSLLLSKQNNDNYDNDNPSNNFTDDDIDVLRQRLFSLHLQILEEELSRPPNANLGPIEVVKAVMEGLLNPYDPMPDSGFRLLLHSSTQKWRTEILRSVGVPMEENDDNNSKKKQQNSTKAMSEKKRRRHTRKDINYEIVASALGSSMGRPHNQFAILVGEAEDFVLDFSASESGQLLDYGDGSCWVECRLRDKHTDDLLVLTGWDLVQRQDDGAWLVDWIYWQDFREGFRPGIGREEWMLEI